MPLMPSAISRNLPSKRWLLMNTSMSPRSCSLDIRFMSSMSPNRLERTRSMVSLMNAFLPGKTSNGASKLPLPNSATQAMAFLLTEMCPATMPLMPSAISRNLPSKRWLSMNTSMSPRSCSLDIRFMSSMSPNRLERTRSMVSLMNAFLPGKASNEASKLPLPNSATHAMAFLLTETCPATMALMPSAMVLNSPSKRWVSMATSMSPFSCSADMRFISAISPMKLARTCSMVSLMKAFLPGKLSKGARKLPLLNSEMQAMAFFLTSMWARTMPLMPSAIDRKSPCRAVASMQASMLPWSCSRAIAFMLSIRALRPACKIEMLACIPPITPGSTSGGVRPRSPLANAWR